jgi:hypothetical protein
MIIGMKERRLTKEQIENRKRLLGRKYREPKPRKQRFKETTEFPPYSFWTPWQTKIWYLGNCLFWVKDLTDDGRCPVKDKKRMLETIAALRQNCDSMVELLNSDKNDERIATQQAPNQGGSAGINK